MSSTSSSSSSRAGALSSGLTTGPATPTGGNANNFPGNGLTSSASLYLYTFLATLILLLIVSASIVARTIVIRRRQRAAQLNGTDASQRRDGIGERPAMYEVYIGDEEDLRGLERGSQETRLGRYSEETRVGRFSEDTRVGRFSLETKIGRESPECRMSIDKEKQKMKERERPSSGILTEWDRMVPVSARWLNPPDSELLPTTAPPPPPPTLPIPEPAHQPEMRTRRWRLPRRSHRLPTIPSQSPLEANAAVTSADEKRFSVSSTEKPPLTPEPPEPPEEKVGVAVLINMPSEAPPRPLGDDIPEQPLPHMEFGMTEVAAGGIAEVLDVQASGSAGAS